MTKASDGRPEKTCRIMPYITVRDPQTASDFYARAFGFAEHERVPGPDGTPMHVGMGFEGESVLMFSPENNPIGNPENMKSPASEGRRLPMDFYVYCPDVDALTTRARAAGARVLSEPEDMFWGDRVARFEDPDGYRWTFATNTGPFDESKMPR